MCRDSPLLWKKELRIKNRMQQRLMLKLREADVSDMLRFRDILIPFCLCICMKSNHNTEIGKLSLFCCWNNLDYILVLIAMQHYT